MLQKQQTLTAEVPKALKPRKIATIVEACLDWNMDITPEIPLNIKDLPGTWSFYKRFCCGATNGILIVPYTERNSKSAQQPYVVWTRVSLKEQKA